ncbi:MAG TPA: hypothetical protein VGQ17_17155 [Gemmatimonadales bacterium]|jgi:hypothetical protein|nr:hypothetical protein [Gemmatimonadales bacterium]
MLRTLARGLLSASLIGLIGGGGGGLASVDALLFHATGRGVEALRPHYEATSGCHADRCAVLSTASESRSVPSVPGAGLSVDPPRDHGAPPPRAALHGLVLLPHYFSRAPPPAS